MENFSHPITDSGLGFHIVMDACFSEFLQYSPEFCCEAVFTLINRNAETLFHVDAYLRVVQNVMLRIIRTYYSSLSAHVVRRILNLYVDIQDFLSLQWNKRNETLSFRERRILGESRRVKEVRSIVERMNHDSGIFFLKSRHVLQIILSGNVTMMDFLVEYGVLHQLQGSWLQEFVDELKSLDVFVNRERHGVHVAVDLDREFDLTDLFPKGFVEIFRDQGRVRRNTLTFLAVLALESRDVRRSVGHARCVRLFFQTIPDDFVTLQEMRELLTRLWRGRESLNVVVSVFATRLAEHYPESKGTREPRSLLSMCRSRIRAEILESDLSLPVAVSGLHIPETLKNYLVISVDDGPET